VAASIVQTKFNTSGSAIASLASASITPSAGSAFVVLVYGSDATSITCADSVNGSYTQVDSFADHFEGNTNQIWATFVKYNVAGTICTPTATFGTTTSFGGGIFVCEVSGAALAAALDGHSANFAGSVDGTPTDSIDPGNITNVNQPALIVGFSGTLGGNTSGGGGTVTVSPGTGFTLEASFGDIYGVQVEQKRITATGSQRGGTWTASGSGATSMFWDALCVVVDEPIVTRPPGRVGSTDSFIGGRSGGRRVQY
jgi:hypothetical protein